MAVYPTALVTTADIPNAGANLSTNPHSSLHDESRDELVAIEAELGIAPSGSYSTVAARLDTGWQPIGSATVSAAASFTITTPASTFVEVQVSIRGQIGTGIEALQMRVNSLSTAMYDYTFARTNSAGTTDGGLVTAATQANIGNITTFQWTTIDLLMQQTNVSSLNPWHSNCSCFSTTGVNARQMQSGGRNTTGTLLSSLMIFPAASTFSGFWTAKGYRL